MEEVPKSVIPQNGVWELEAVAETRLLELCTESSRKDSTCDWIESAEGNPTCDGEGVRISCKAHNGFWYLEGAGRSWLALPPSPPYPPYAPS